MVVFIDDHFLIEIAKCGNIKDSVFQVFRVKNFITIGAVY